MISITIQGEPYQEVEINGEGIILNDTGILQLLEETIPSISGPGILVTTVPVP